MLFSDSAKYMSPSDTFESVSDEHVSAIGGKIACHFQVHPSSPFDVAEPVGGVSAVLAPAVEQYVESKVRTVVVHPVLQPFGELRQGDFWLLFHKNESESGLT